MRICECVTLLCIFVISPPHCSTSTIQQQNQTPLPAGPIRVADDTVQPCGQPKNDGKVQQDPKKTRGFPEGKNPLDPLSIGPVKLKTQKDRQGRIKGSQKRRTGAGSLQIATGQNSSLTEIRAASGSSMDPTEKSSKSNSQQRAEISESAAHNTNTEKNNPSSRTRNPRPGFGFPVDRIGHGRLPSGRR